jgi:hypothetical protein
LYRRLGWPQGRSEQVQKISPPTGIRSLDHPARSQSLYRLCYPAQNFTSTFLIIKPTRCIEFSNLFSEWNSTCFGQLLCPSSRVFHCTHSNGIRHTCLLTACEQGQDETSWSCLLAVSKPVWRIPLLCVQWKSPDELLLIQVTGRQHRRCIIPQAVNTVLCSWGWGKLSPETC